MSTEQTTRFHFNIVYDRWITVIMKKGNKETLSLRDFFEQAHNIERLNVKTDCYMDELSVFMFATALAEDMLAPVSRTRLDHTLRHGRFDMEIFDTYIEKCEKEGVSFDAFDEERPFMQISAEKLEEIKKLTKKESRDGKKILEPKSVAELLPPTYPKGNNVIFFVKPSSNSNYGKVYEEQHRIPHDLFFISLLRSFFSRHKGGSGINSTLFGSNNMICIMPVCRSMFESIFCSIPKKETDAYAGESLPMWRRKEYEMPSYGYAPTFLANVFVPSVYLRYADVDENGMVSHVYLRGYPKGAPFNPSIGETLLDKIPFFLVNNKENTKGGKRKIAQLRNESSSFYDMLCSLSGISNYWNYGLSSGMTIFEDYKGYLGAEQETISFMLYGIRWNQGIMESQKRTEIVLPADIYSEKKSSSFRSCFKNYVELVGKIGERYFIALRCVYGLTKAQYGSPKDPSSKRAVEEIKNMSSRCRLRFYDGERDYYNNTLERILSCKDEDGEFDALFSTIKREVLARAIEVYTDVVRKKAGNIIDWYRGLDVMRRGGQFTMNSQEYGSSNTDWNNKKNDERREAVRDGITKLYDLMAQCLSNNELYKLRSDFCGNFDKAPAVNQMICYSVPNVSGCKQEHVYIYMTIFADKIIRERKGEKTRAATSFLNCLIELRGFSDTWKQKVNILLSMDNPFADANIGFVARMLKMMRRYDLDLMDACTELERFTYDKSKLAIAIGQVEANAYIDQKEVEEVLN